MENNFQEVVAAAQIRWQELSFGDKPWIRIGSALCGKAAGCDAVTESIDKTLESQGIQANVSQVELCWGSSCHLVGAMAVIDQVLQETGLEEEGDTPDGQLTVRLNTCLGACAQAPVISINHELIGRISPSEARRRVALVLADSNASQVHHT